jgi:hypothetical protein
MEPEAVVVAPAEEVVVKKTRGRPKNSGPKLSKKCVCQCPCPCHKPGSEPTVKVVKAPRKKSDKAPSAAQVAQREKFKEKNELKKKLKSEHPDWTSKQIHKEAWGK